MVNTAGYVIIVIMTDVYSPDALKVHPPFQHYDAHTVFTSLVCSDDDGNQVSGDEIEWLNSNLTLLNSTATIDGSYFSICN